MKNNLKLAQCCGSCVHSNKPIAKTQRWCFKNNCHTTRECVCDCYEPITKGGSVASSKRVFSFNRRLERIQNVVNKMKELNIDKIELSGTTYLAVINDRLCYCCDRNYFGTTRETYTRSFRGDDSDFDRYEKIINEQLGGKND